MSSLVQIPSLPVLLEGLPLPPELAARVLEYARAADGALAGNTARAFRADMRVWGAWCRAQDRLPVPADATLVARFIGAMTAEKAPATVRRYVASIAVLHRAAGVPSPSQDATVRLALKRLARTKGTRQRQVAPLDERAEQAILSATGPTLIDLRDRALLLVARDLLARRSELVALLVADLDLSRPEASGGTALIRRAKTDQEGQGAVGYLAPATVHALRAWMAGAAIESGPLFHSVRRNGSLGRPLNPGEVARIFKKLARRAGIAEADAVAGHSARVGMAQDLVAAGADLPAVMQAGRWKSPAMPARYAERLLAERNAVAKFRGAAS